MSEPKTAIDEIKGRIAALESQIGHEEEEQALLAYRMRESSETIHRLQILRDQWVAVLELMEATARGAISADEASVRLLTGFSREQLDEVGGLPEAGR